MVRPLWRVCGSLTEQTWLGRLRYPGAEILTRFPRMSAYLRPMAKTRQ